LQIFSKLNTFKLIITINIIIIITITVIIIIRSNTHIIIIRPHLFFFQTLNFLNDQIKVKFRKIMFINFQSFKIFSNSAHSLTHILLLLQKNSLSIRGALLNKIKSFFSLRYERVFFQNTYSTIIIIIIIASSLIILLFFFFIIITGC
jgi:hypothetical protein